MTTNSTTPNRNFLGRAADSVNRAAGATVRYINGKKKVRKQNRVNGFMNSQAARQCQAADAMNNYLEANTAAMARIDVINSYDPANPNLDLETVLQSLEQIASVDISNTEAREYYHSSPSFLDSLLKLSDSSSYRSALEDSVKLYEPGIDASGIKHRQTVVDSNVIAYEAVQRKAAQILDILATDENEQEYLLNTELSQNNLDNFLNIAKAHKPEEKMAAVAQFLEDMSIQPGSLVSNIDSFITSLEKGQAGELGFRAVELFKKGDFAQELMLFLKEPGIYLDTSGDTAKSKLTAEVMRKPENLPTLDRLSAVSQKIFRQEASEVKTEWLDPCLDLLSHDESIQERGREKFASQYHGRFEETATLRLSANALQDTYTKLKNSVNNNSVKEYLIDKNSETINFLVEMISQDKELMNSFTKMLEPSTYTRLLNDVSSENGYGSVSEVRSEDIDNYLSLNQAYIKDLLILDSPGTIPEEIALQGKHMSLLRITKDRAATKVKGAEENLVEEFAQITKAITKLKIPFSELYSSIKTESEGLGNLILKRLIKQDENGSDIFSKYRPDLPDSAVNFEEGTIQKFIQSHVEQESETSLMKTLQHTKRNLERLNDSMALNQTEEMNNWAEIFIASDILIQGFEDIAIESESARTFINTRDSYSQNEIELIKKLNELSLSSTLSSNLMTLQSDVAGRNNDQALLQAYFEVSSDAKEFPDNKLYREVAGLVKDRLEQRKQMQTSFLGMMKEEYDFQGKNGFTHPMTRLANFVNRNVSTAISSGIPPNNLPSPSQINDFFTNAGQSNLTELFSERQENLSALQSNLDQYEADLILVKDAKVRNQRAYSAKSGVIVDEYAKFTQIFKTMLINPDKGIKEAYEKNINEEIEFASQSRPVSFENGKVNSQGGAIRDEFSLGNMLINVLKFLSVPFQDLLRGVSESAGK